METTKDKIGKLINSNKIPTGRGARSLQSQIDAQERLIFITAEGIVKNFDW